jgi:AmmeMemoRadiSam system protein B
MIRPPAVAGRFYPKDPEVLGVEIDSLLASGTQQQKIRAQACLVPHAGYRYSGEVAGEVYSRMEIPARVVLLGPRHFPRGASFAILSDGAWKTPLGLAPIDHPLAEKIMRACRLLREDSVAHESEHSLEVQLPFLQRLAPSFAFVPIVIGSAQFADLEELGHAIADVVGSELGPILLIASSDMNHYESDAVTRVKDRKAIDRILALDPRGLFDTVRNEDISMCGYGAAVAMLTAVRHLAAKHAELVRYATSGDVGGDLQEVVGYAGIIIEAGSKSPKRENEPA